MENVMQWAGFFRDIIILFGLPGVYIAVHKLISKLHKEKVGLLEIQIKTLEREKKLMEQTQYDKAAQMMKSQRDIMLLEREEAALKHKKQEKENAELRKTIEEMQAKGEEPKEKEEKLKAKLKADEKKSEEMKTKIKEISAQINDLKDKEDNSFLHGIESEALRKLKIISKEYGGQWIDSYIFGSETYGCGIGQVEQNFLALKGWIEVSGNKVRITEEGLKVGQE